MKAKVTDQYSSYDNIPAAVKAWITRRAVKAGKNPTMVHAGIKAYFTRIQNTSA